MYSRDYSAVTSPVCYGNKHGACVCLAYERKSTCVRASRRESDAGKKEKLYEVQGENRLEAFSRRE
jgi:hypothetical protein